MNFPLYIARRIFSYNDDKQQVSKPAIRIAMAGVAIGLAVMVVSVSVILGFKHTIRDKVVGFGSHITVANFNTLHGSSEEPIDAPDSLIRVLRKAPGTKHLQGYALTQGILKTDADFLGVVFKGVDESFDSTFIHSCLRSGRIPRFSKDKNGNEILISQTIADKLRLHSGDRIFAYFIGDGGVRTRRFTIAGVYQTNMSYFDKAFCYCDLYTAAKLNGWPEGMVSGIEIQVDDFSECETTARYVVKNVNRLVDRYGNTYSSETIQELYPQIFSWLNLLDLNVWIILALMVCVAGITMISGLLIIILERTNMIGILKALGCTGKAIRHTFVWFAIFIIGKGLVIGNVLGIGLVVLQRLTSLVKLDASTYYVDTVPVEINIPIILLINIATLLICVFVLIAPSYLASSVDPAKSMKYE